MSRRISKFVNEEEKINRGDANYNINVMGGRLAKIEVLAVPWHVSLFGFASLRFAGDVSVYLCVGEGKATVLRPCCGRAVAILTDCVCPQAAMAGHKFARHESGGDAEAVSDKGACSLLSCEDQTECEREREEQREEEGKQASDRRMFQILF